MIKKQKEEIVKHAVLKWQGEHPDKKYLDIKYRETIVLKGIGKVNIGREISSLRNIYKSQQEGTNNTENNLSKEAISWYTKRGMIWDYEAWQEKVYRHAVLKWQALHPEKKYLDIKKKEQIELEGIGLINLGVLISVRRGIYNAMQQGQKYQTCKDLTEEQIAWDEDHGMIWDYEAWQEKVYKNAVLKWKAIHPDRTNLDISHKETINLDGIGTINIGQKICLLRYTYKVQIRGERNFKNLTEEQIAWYTEQGMIWDYKKYQEERKGKIYQKKL